MPRPTNLPQPSDSFTSIDQATKSYTHTPTEAEQQQITTVVGNPDLTDFFYPHVRMSRWGGEAWIELQLQYNAGAFEESVEDFGDGRLVFTHADAQMRFYPLGEDDLPGDNDALGHGGYEIDAVLAARPAQNSVSFNVVTNNCDLLYQPSQATQEAENGYAPGEIDVPEWVEGSYAVYASSGLNNNKYRTGKVCHLFRPVAIDDNGDQIYCDYNDDAATTGVLTVTIDRQWLRDAAYPVVIDPTAGYSTKGASTIACANNVARLGTASGTYDDSTGSLGSDSTVDSSGAHAYLKRTSGVPYAKPAIYLDTGTVANDTKMGEGTTQAITGTTVVQWDWDISGTMNSGSTYRMGVMGSTSPNTNVQVAYDSGGTDNHEKRTESSYVWPSDLTSYVSANERISVWFDYTAVSSETARITAVDADITYDLKTGRITAADADITYDLKTGRITAADADITYTYPANARITAADADITYDPTTARITAADADITYEATTARVTAVDADVTYTFDPYARITAADADVTYVRTVTYSKVFGRSDVGFRIVPDPGSGGGAATKGGYIPED